MRQKHHKPAQLCAAGLSDIEVAALTGYTPEYIRSLRGYSPAFQELIAHYGAEANAVLQNELSDLKVKQTRVAELALDEMTERLAEKPESFSSRELNEVIETNLVKPALASAKLGMPLAAPTQVSIQFVTSKGDTSAKLIEGDSK